MAPSCKELKKSMHALLHGVFHQLIDDINTIFDIKLSSCVASFSVPLIYHHRHYHLLSTPVNTCFLIPLYRF